MLKINKIDVMSLAKVLGMLYAVFGLIIGVIVSITYMMGINVPAERQASSMGFGVASVLVFPIIYGIMGFIGGAATAFFYNLVSQRIGGIKVEAEQIPSGS